MAKRNVFYSFHFNNDVFRVQMIRQMGVLAGDEPVSANTWEEIKRTDKGVEEWINKNLDRKTCLIVLIGSETAERKWVKHEIKRAWERDIPIVGVYIHNLKCARTGYGTKGSNPFSAFTFKRKDGTTYTPKVFNPDTSNAYKDIEENLSQWIEDAITDCA